MAAAGARLSLAGARSARCCDAGLSEHAATGLLVLGLGGYGLWLHWFLARHGLELSRLRAALLVMGVNLGTACLVLLPRLLLQRP